MSAFRATWFVRKKNAPWYGKAGENSTIWSSPSPKFIMGGSKEPEDGKLDHPTQKPVELMRRPILNHTKRGELVYEPFLGSGTTLAAAELTERVRGIRAGPRQVRGYSRGSRIPAEGTESIGAQLLHVPHGLAADELATYLREHGDEICNPSQRLAGNDTPVSRVKTAPE